MVSNRSDGEVGPRRIAIVGGGCAALAAAWDLTSPQNPERCEVTIFQIGGRLGGKGASSRNRDVGSRIEEHGLHLWLGYYENAFQLIRGCYDELKNLNPTDAELQRVWRASAFNNWDWLTAFERASLVSLADQTSGDWEPWVARFPEYVWRGEATRRGRTPCGARLPGMHTVEDRRRAYPGEPPGDPDADTSRGDDAPSVAFFLEHALRDLQAFVASLEERLGETPGEAERAALEDDSDRLLADALRAPSTRGGAGGSDNALSLLQTIRLTILVPTVQAVASLARFTQGPLPYVRTRIVAFLDSYVDAMRGKIEANVQHDLVARRLWELIDLLVANIRGVIAAGLEGHQGFDSLDDWNYVDWLRMNRISERTLRNPIIRGSHDLAFAYQNGNEHEPQFAAGQALNAACRFFFMYKGAIFWRMCAGMGDVVFAPLYIALRQRGVKFRFFHRLDDIELDASETSIAALHFSRQVPLKDEQPNAATNYAPLVLIDDLACWPERPDASQFDFAPDVREAYMCAVSSNDPAVNMNFESLCCTWPQGSPVRVEIGERTGSNSEDGRFDAAIITVPIAALARVSGKLVNAGAAGERWKSMLEQIGTVATQSVQLWMTCETHELGWTHGQVNLASFVHPFDTWADLSHLTRVEKQPSAKGVHYLCSVLADYRLPASLRPPLQAVPADPMALASAKATVKENARRFLTNSAFHLWPLAVDRYPSEFKWQRLVSDETLRGDVRLDSQHFVANVDPSERYTQSLPGTTKYRIRPGDTRFERLYVAGDWTDCGLNVGCVEAAVMSGRLASSAITQYPNPQHIPGLPADHRHAVVKERS